MYFARSAPREERAECGAGRDVFEDLGGMLVDLHGRGLTLTNCVFNSQHM